MCGKCLVLERRGPFGLDVADAPRPNPNALLLRQRRLQEMQVEAGELEGQQQRQQNPFTSSSSSFSSSSYHYPVLFDSNAQFCGVLSEPPSSISSSSSSERPTSIVTHDGKRYNLIDCEHCGRTFIESKIFIHQRTCTATTSLPNVQKPLEKRVRKQRSPSGEKTIQLEVQAHEQNNDEISIPGSEEKTVFDTVDMLAAFHERRKRQEQQQNL